MSDISKELLIGAHTSAAGGAYNALLEGKKIGATTIQLFTSNQKRWDSKVLDQSTIDIWNRVIEETGLKQIMSHDSYLINLGSSDSENLLKSRKAFREEVRRSVQLGISYLNFHPGAALKDPVELCLDRICESLLEIKDLVSDTSTCLLLEATAGQGSSVGHRFEHLAYIIQKVGREVPIGVCIDTCHIFAAGYDIRNSHGWEATLKEFNEIVGLPYLKAFHINDSAKGLGTRVDRHASLGKGMIGLECFKFLMNDSRTRNIPKYLETPEGPIVWAKEIELLRQFANER
jgi:deoxyribonuclease-4